MHSIITQALGFIAGALWVWSVSLKSDKQLNQVWIVSNAVWALHYALLGGWVGALNHGVNIVRSGLYVAKDWRASPYKWHIFAGLMIAFTAVSLYKYENWTDFFPLYSSYTTCLAFFIFPGIAGRLWIISGNLTWLAYAVIHQSYGGMISQVAVILVSLHTIYRLNAAQKMAPLAANAVELE